MSITVDRDTDPRLTKIYGDSVDEIMDFMMPRIRRVSQEFYSREIPKDLEHDGSSLIDMHAAGEMTRVFLNG